MPRQSDKTFRASDVDVEFIELLTASGTFDIRPQLVSFVLYEDIFNPCINIELGINDSVNIPFAGPIVGEEVLNMRFATKSTGGKGAQSEIDPGDMYMVSIKQRHIAKDRQQIYVLRFTSQQSIINHNTKISKSYRGKRIDEIVRNIFDEYLDIDENYDEISIDETKGIENIVIPNWKPFDAIQWLAKRAINTNNVPNYLYWEANSGTFFRSLDTLVTQPIVQSFRYNPMSDDTTKLESAKQGVMELDSLEIKNQFNVIHNIEDGFYASKLITHDIVRKKIEERVLGLDELYNGTINHSDPFMPISSEDTIYNVQDRYNFAKPFDPDRKGENLQSFFDSNVKLYPKHNQMFAETSTDFYDNKVEDWFLKRNALMTSLNQIKLEIAFPAISGLHVGHMVNLVVPAPAKVLKTATGQIKNVEDLQDRLLSGKYIITAIKHTINFMDKDTTMRYRMICELTKDAIGSPVPGGVKK